MKFITVFMVIPLYVFGLLLSGSVARAQTGNEASVSGTVADPTGAIVANASVNIHNAVSGYDRTATTDSSGNFTFPNVPFNPYHITVNAMGFATYAEDIEVRSNVPLVLAKINLQVAGTSSTVTVEAAGELVENDSTDHTDIDRNLFQDVPLESSSSSLSSLVTLASPGVAADSNGLFHGLGDHAANSFSVDGQPITDQQSKVFSNQTPGRRGAVYGGDRRRAARRIRRQNQPGHRCNHALGAGRNHASRQRHHFLRHLWHGERRFRSCLRRPEVGQLHLRQRPEHRPLSRRAGIHGDAR